MGLTRLLRYHSRYAKGLLRQWMKRSALRWRGVELGPGCHIGNRVELAPGCRVLGGTRLNRNVRLGPGVSVGHHCLLANISVGENSALEGGVSCTGHGQGSIHIGRESYIGIGAVLDWSDTVRIGDFVHIAGPSTGIWTHSSARQCTRGLPLADKDPAYRPLAPVTIQDQVYIGGNCTIYPGVTIGHHSIVAPNSAVTRDVPPHSLVGGVPAQVIKTLEPA